MNFMQKKLFVVFVLGLIPTYNLPFFSDYI